MSDTRDKKAGIGNGDQKAVETSREKGEILGENIFLFKTNYYGLIWIEI